MGKALIAMIAIFLVGLAPESVAWAQDQPPPKRVLMLYGHDPKARRESWLSPTQLHAIVRADSPTRVVFYDELLDLERFPENADREELVNYIRREVSRVQLRRHPGGWNEGPEVRHRADERSVPRASPSCTAWRSSP